MKIRYFGNELEVDIRSSFDERMVWIEEGSLVVCSQVENEAIVWRLVDTWRSAEAKRYILQRVRELAEQTGLEVERVSFRRQKTRWGSCSSEKNLSMNLRLIEHRPEIIDYVIIHELAHTVEMNHSRLFWDIVAKHCPDYRLLDRQLSKRNKS